MKMMQGNANNPDHLPAIYRRAHGETHPENHECAYYGCVPLPQPAQATQDHIPDNKEMIAQQFPAQGKCNTAQPAESVEPHKDCIQRHEDSIRQVVNDEWQVKVDKLFQTLEDKGLLIPDEITIAKWHWQRIIKSSKELSNDRTRKEKDEKALREIATADVEWFLSRQPKPTEELRESIVQILFENDRLHYKDRETFGELADSILSLIQPKIERPESITDQSKRIMNRTEEVHFGIQPKIDRPKIVCLCGSTRFEKEYIKVSQELTLKGNIVLTAHVFRDIERTPEINAQLYKLHLSQIDLSDEVLVLNVGGYIGESTRSEIQYAIEHGKTVRYLEAVCRD